MSFRKTGDATIGQKLEYGRKSDEPKNEPRVRIGNKDLNVRQVRTSKIGVDDPDILTVPSIDAGDQLLTNKSSTGSQRGQSPSLGSQAQGTSTFTLESPSKLTLGNKVMRGVFGFIGGLVAGLGGAAAGFIGGTLIGTPITGIGAAVVLGGIGAASGVSNGVALADSISRLFDNAPQDKHLDKAMHSLQASRGPFTPSEARNLKSVSAREWRNLLPVHQKKPWFGNDKRVGGRENRQKIREAVVLYVAKHGKAGAADYRDRLIAAANSRTPNALQTEINRLKASDIERQLDAISNMGNTEQKAVAFQQLVGDNPDIFLQPSALQNSFPFKANAEKIGLLCALSVVDRMERTGRITEQDRQDLNRAMNIQGKPDNEAHPDPAATKDVLGPLVGRYYTPEAKHKVAQALYRQFGANDAPYSNNLYSEPRRILQSTLDPVAFNQDLEDNKISRVQYGAHADQPRFEDVPQEQRASVAEAEIAAMRAAAKLTLTADTMVNEIVREMGNASRDMANRFETPSQEAARLRQERQEQVKAPKTDSKQSLEQLKSLRDRYVPGGDRFEAIRKNLGLKDGEFDKEQLVRGINGQLANIFGNNGQRLSPDMAANHADAEVALLRAISGHFSMQLMGIKPLVSGERATELKELAANWESNGIPGNIPLDKPVNVQGRATDRFAGDVETIANKNFGNHVPEPLDNDDLAPMSGVEEAGDLTRPEKFDDGVHEQFLGDITRGMAVRINGKKIPNDEKGAREALSGLDDEERKALTAYLHQGLPQAIGKALGDPKDKSQDAFLPGLPSDQDHVDNRLEFDVTTNKDGTFDVKVGYEQHINTALPTDPLQRPTLYDPDQSYVAYRFNAKIDPQAMNPFRLTSPIDYKVKLQPSD